VKNEQMREELARFRMKQSSIEAERDGLAAEVQRLTDALHNRSSEPAVAATPEAPVAKTEVAPAVQAKDAVGRPIEQSLADIEDLIANSVPSPQNRR
jgi:hypothetical protein